MNGIVICANKENRVVIGMNKPNISLCQCLASMIGGDKVLGHR